MKKLYVSLALAAALGCSQSVEFKASETVLVRGEDVCAELAVKEFNEIAEKATGKRIAEGGEAKRKIYVGRSAEAVKILGKDFLNSLKDEESVVMMKGGDLFLVGGGSIGTLYAVYDFLEDNAGYRWYFDRDGGDVIDKCDELVFKGKSTRKKPAFAGYRKDHSNKRGTELFRLRNRDNEMPERFIKGYRYPFASRIGGHGFLFYIPEKDPTKREGFRPPEIKGQFKLHPEYFSLNKDGKRIPDMQLCLSNPKTRRALTEALMAWIKARGKGVYMIGSNDNHNTRYCWCDGCVALEKKYNSVGGPLWEYILEACAELKKRNIDGVYIQSLAYKGPTQTERAPAGVEKFPDNFICDAAFLNADRSLREVEEMKLEDGTIFRRFENLQKWTSLCNHVSYWFYGGNNPSLVLTRMQKEIKELREAGVKSVGACGTGGGYEFRDMTKYLYYLLLRNPDADARGELKKMLAVKYGTAAKNVLEYIDGIDAARLKAVEARTCLLSTDRLYDGFSFLSGKELADWQELFDRAEAAVAGDEDKLRNVREARIGLDLWTIVYANKVRSECPGFKLDVKAIEKRVRDAAQGYGKRCLTSGERNEALETLDEMGNYANLKSNELPPELKKYSADKVFRFLPPVRGKHYCPHLTGKWTSEADTDAVCGYAVADTIPEDFDYAGKGGVSIEYYDVAGRKFLINGIKHKIPVEFFEKGKYKLWRVGVSTIPSRSNFVIGGMWSSPLAMRVLSRCFDPSYVGKEFEIWVSVKAEGPKFFKGSTGDSKIYLEQIFAVDLGVPDSK